MTYASIESSRSQSKPVQLYFFRYGVGANNYAAYNDGGTPISFDPGDGTGSVVFQPMVIDSDSIKSKGGLDNTENTVEMNNTNAIADLFDGWPPSYVIQLYIWRGHVGQNDFIRTFTGRVTGAGGEDSTNELKAIPVSSALYRLGVRRCWQLMCPHPLYSQGAFQCKASKAAGTVTANCASLVSPNITFSNGWNGAKPAPKFVNGIAEWTGPDGQVHVRTIMAVTGNVLRMSGKIKGLVAGQAVKLSVGCSNTEDDCQNLHNNINNYGGQAWIPIENPFGVKNIYN